MGWDDWFCWSSVLPHRNLCCPASNSAPASVLTLFHHFFPPQISNKYIISAPAQIPQLSASGFYTAQSHFLLVFIMPISQPEGGEGLWQVSLIPSFQIRYYTEEGTEGSTHTAYRRGIEEQNNTEFSAFFVPSCESSVWLLGTKNSDFWVLWLASASPEGRQVDIQEKASQYWEKYPLDNWSFFLPLVNGSFRHNLGEMVTLLIYSWFVP